MPDRVETGHVKTIRDQNRLNPGPAEKPERAAKPSRPNPSNDGESESHVHHFCRSAVIDRVETLEWMPGPWHNPNRKMH